MRSVICWLLLPLMLILTTIVLGWLIILYLPCILGLHQYYYSLIAILWIIETYIIAPNMKLIVTGVTLIVGIFITLYFITPSFYPEWHYKAYEATYLPSIMIILSGVISFFMIRSFHHNGLRQRKISKEGHK